MPLPPASGGGPMIGPLPNVPAMPGAPAGAVPVGGGGSAGSAAPVPSVPAIGSGYNPLSGVGWRTGPRAVSQAGSHAPKGAAVRRGKAMNYYREDDGK